jgi:PAS domain S-box-containing protein
MVFSATTLKLLLVEDNAGDAILIEEYLKEEIQHPVIHHVSTFAGAKEKLSGTEVYDAILLDLSLPDATAKQLVGEMLRLAAAVPVIILTGYGDKDFGIQALSHGISDYLMKDGLSAGQLYRSIAYSIERKKIALKFNESEEKHRKLFQNGPLPMWVYDPESFRFLDVNEAAIGHYGYSREEFMSMSIRDIRPASEVKHMEKMASLSKIKGGAFEGLFSHYKKDGSLINVNIRSNSIDFNGIKARLVLASDITEKIKAEEALRLSEQRFRGLVQEGSDLIVILDIHGNYKYVSPTSMSILGMNPGKFNGKSVFDYIHEEDRRSVANHYKLLLTQKQVQIPPFRFITEKGDYRWLETIVTNLMDDPSIGGIVANSKDVSQRYAYEDRLRKQESLFRKIIEKSSDMKALITLEGIFIFGTPSITRIFGYEQEDYLGQNINSFVHPDDAAGFLGELNNMITFKKPSFTMTLRLRNKAGQYRWCEKTLTNLLEDDDVGAIVCNFRDITENKEAEIKIKESNDRYNLVAKATSDAIWDYDAVNNKTFISGSGYKYLFGYNIVNDFTEESFWESCLHPEEKERVMNDMYKAITDKNTEQCSLEYRMLKANGNYAYVRDRFFIIREQGQVVRMIGAKQDITRQKEEEQHLRLLESVITNTKDAAIITDADTSNEGPKTVYVNEAFIKMTGYQREEIIGQTPRMFQGQATEREKLDRIRTAMEEKQGCDVEVVNYTKSGSPYWVEMSIAPVMDALGRVTHFIAIERDITNRKTQEQEREKLIHELTQNNIDLRQFSYITSHNLRGPIASLLGLCSLIDLSAVQDKTLKQILEGVKKATFMFDETLRDLSTVLNIRDRTSIPKEDLMFFSVFEKSLAQLKSLVTEANAVIESDFSAAPVVNYNKAYLESIFSNLISNAVKYRSPDRRLQVSITTEQTDECIVMKFKDNGLGIDTVMHKEKIFRLHQRFHNHAEGKGLGLFLVKSQLESLGGTIDLESKEGEGTTFTLKFKK